MQSNPNLGKPTAKIEKDTSGKGLWMMIEGSNDPNNDCAWPITEDEVEPIARACVDWMLKHPGKDAVVMKGKK